MTDPLGSFAWGTLFKRYDCLCRRFDPASLSLQAFAAPPKTDRELYHFLVARIALERQVASGISLGWYEAMLYWKLYSQPAAVANVCRRLQCDSSLRAASQRALANVSLLLPSAISQSVEQIVGLLNHPVLDKLFGMASATAFPVRSTLLHFVYPDAVPVFDKLVLQAVGVRTKNANHDEAVLRSYLPFAWDLAVHHNPQKQVPGQESALRLIDMALWVSRS